MPPDRMDPEGRRLYSRDHRLKKYLRLVGCKSKIYACDIFPSKIIRKMDFCKFTEVHFLFKSSQRDTTICPQAYFTLRKQYITFPKGNISLSRQGKYHWRLRKEIFATAFGGILSASDPVKIIFFHNLPLDRQMSLCYDTENTSNR